MPPPFKWFLFFGPSHTNFIDFSPLSHACHMPCLPHSPWLDLPSDIWGWVQIIKHLIVQLTSFLLGPNILLRTLFSNTVSLCSSLSVRDNVSHPYITVEKLWFCIF
jgi:hypothetical protein